MSCLHESNVKVIAFGIPLNFCQDCNEIYGELSFLFDLFSWVYEDDFELFEYSGNYFKALKYYLFKENP